MEQPPTLIDADASSAPTLSLGARLLGIYATPGDVFEDVVRSKPSITNWLVPTILVALVGMIYVFVIFSQPFFIQQIREKQEQQIDKMIEKGQLKAEQKEGVMAQTEKFGIAMVRITGSLGAAAGSFAWLFVLGLVLKLIGSRAFGGHFHYMKAVEVVGLASMVTMLGAIIQMFLALVTGSMLSTLGPSLIIKDLQPSNKLHLALSSLNLITLWYIAILSIGLSKLSGVTVLKAALWLFGLWIALRGIVIGVGWGSSGM